MAVTRIKNNQIFDATITAAKIKPATLTGGLFSPELTLNSNVTIIGNLDVQGETSTVSSVNTYVNDPLLVLNNAYVGAPTYDIGLLVNRNLNPLNAAWIWSESDDAFVGVLTTETGNTQGTISRTGGFANLIVGDITAGNIEISGAIEAGSATFVAINGTPIGNTTPSTGNFTTLTAISADFDAINDTVIGNVTPSSGAFTTLSATSGITGTLQTNAQPNITSVGTLTELTVSGATDLAALEADSITTGSATITGGSITNTSISGSTGSFTTLAASGNTTFDGFNANVSLTPGGTGQVFIYPATEGEINNMVIGAVDPAAAYFTTVQADSINAGSATFSSINNTPIGNAVPSTGAFTTLSATSGITGTLQTNAQPNITSVGILTELTVSGFTSLQNTSALSLETGNLVATGGTLDEVVIGNITPAAGYFTTLSAGTGITGLLQTSSQPNITSVGTLTGLTVSGSTSLQSLSAVDGYISGNLDVVSNVGISGELVVGGVGYFDSTEQSVSVGTGAIVTLGGVGVAGNINVGGEANIGNISVEHNTISSITGNLNISSTGVVKIGTLTMPQVDGVAGAVMTTDGNGVVSLQSLSNAGVTGNNIILGTPTSGTLVDNNPAITTWTETTKVTDAVDRLNEVLGKLVPPQPPVFPGSPFTLTIQGLAPAGTLRMTDFTQTDNTTTASKQLGAGLSLTNYRRSASFTTNSTNDVGPGNTGTVTANKNGTVTGTRAIVEGTGNNGTYGELVISDNSDYGTKTNTALDFWYSYDASASGTVSEGWNEIYLDNTAGSPTNTAVWYYDASAPGTPVITQTSFTPTSVTTEFSSSVPHYTSATIWTWTGTVNRLSGDLYPNTNTFFTGTAGGSFQTPASVTYTDAGVATPLARNLYVSSGSATVNSNVAIANSTGVSSTGPSFSAINSYATGNGSATVGGNVLRINTSSATALNGTTGPVNENLVNVGTFGSGGSATAVRVGAGTGATPSTGTITAWNSSATLATHEAAVVAGVASRDLTNYSTGYFPTGPDLSGQDTIQYITFRIQRAATSKFNINFTGRVSGVYVAMPGSSLDTTAASTNGWIDATVSYAGSGVPGTGTGGNGSNGCALGGIIVTGSTGSQNKTVTFGTESSTNSTNNYIYVRFVLGAGDSITALSFPNPTN